MNILLTITYNELWTLGIILNIFKIDDNSRGKVLPELGKRNEIKLKENEAWDKNLKKWILNSEYINS